MVDVAGFTMNLPAKESIAAGFIWFFIFVGLAIVLGLGIIFILVKMNEKKVI